MEKICVLGLGYIGLPTAATLASKGYQVYGVDIKKDIIKSLKESRVHIEEPLLTQLVQQTIASGCLVPKEVPEEADVFIIAVPTPKTHENKCELKYLIEATKSIVPYISEGNIIILESTVTPGTTEEVMMPIIEEGGLIVGVDIYLAHCPERVLPGSIIKEITQNSRIIGGYTEECANKAKAIYQSFVTGQIILTDLKTAEMTKLVENTFRDVNIAFANELVKVCDALSIDAIKVIELANEHPRVNILQPGPGVGGHCLAIDPYYLISSVPELTKLISTAREVNCSMPSFIVSKVEQMLEGIDHPKIVVLGITYKENIDDVRESPSIEIIRLLREKNYEVIVCDPHIDDKLYQQREISESAVGADIIIILVSHDEFKNLDFGLLSQRMRTPLVFDTKNIIDRDCCENVIIKKLGRIS
jgi:UDP-N-acetyl-D-mannosaminuronic acid dehydrogenase